jgi:hypothetical protein
VRSSISHLAAINGQLAPVSSHKLFIPLQAGVLEPVAGDIGISLGDCLASAISAPVFERAAVGACEMLLSQRPFSSRSSRRARPQLQRMMEAVHRYDGYVAQSTGDGIFALFGAPVAHEDHPQRAVYAALRMQEELKRYSDTLRTRGQAPLSMRPGGTGSSPRSE